MLSSAIGEVIVTYIDLGYMTLCVLAFFSIVGLIYRHYQLLLADMKLNLSQQEVRLQEALAKQQHLSTDIALAEQQLTSQSAELVSWQQRQSQWQTQQDAQQLAITKLTAQKAESDSREALLQAQLIEQKNIYASNCEQLDTANQTIAQLQAKEREQQALMVAEKEKLVSLTEQFAFQKTELKNEFKALSEEIMETRQKTLAEQNQTGITALLKPLQEQIMGFQQRINQVHSEALKGNTQLEAEIKKVMEVGMKIGGDAANLTSALKGNAQQRGAWGEAQLERTLEMSGLIDTVHYEKQSSFKDSTGRQKQTDYLIKLPDNKHIIIDSKVSLIDYDRAVAAVDEQAYEMALKAHITAVKRHIDELAAKDYTNLIGMHSPSFVLMFMPIEPAYIEALKHSKTLFSYGYDHNIVLVSHTTLIPILRTVANLWMLEKSQHEAREVSEKAGEIYNSVCTVAERLQKLGNTLNTASQHYNSAVKAISGRQGLQGKVERFTTLSSKISKTMPEITSKHIDFDTAQLEAKPIEAKIALDEKG